MSETSRHPLCSLCGGWAGAVAGAHISRGPGGSRHSGTRSAEPPGLRLLPGSGFRPQASLSAPQPVGVHGSKPRGETCSPCGLFFPFSESLVFTGCLLGNKTAPGPEAAPSRRDAATPRSPCHGWQRASSLREERMSLPTRAAEFWQSGDGSSHLPCHPVCPGANPLHDDSAAAAPEARRQPEAHSRHSHREDSPPRRCLQHRNSGSDFPAVPGSARWRQIAEHRARRARGLGKSG